MTYTEYMEKILAEPQEVRLWWQQTTDYWELPFFADAGLCCEAMLRADDFQSAREQLWAIREGLV